MHVFINWTRRTLQRSLLADLFENRLLTVIVVLIGPLLIGTAGYMIVEGWSLMDSFYMTVISLTTVGYGETNPLSTAGRVFTSLVIIMGVGGVAYATAAMVEYIVTGQLLGTIEARRRRHMIDELHEHFIIAGFGRVGRETASELYRQDVPFLIIDASDEGVELARSYGYLVMKGNAHDDDTLQQAGIERARALVSTASSDANNLYVVLTARVLNPDLFIVSRAVSEASESKLLHAGADRVISPYALGGRRMANLALRPFVVEFLDHSFKTGHLVQRVEEIEVGQGALLSDMTFVEANMRRRSGGATVLAIYQPTGELKTNPRDSDKLTPGARLIVLGTGDQLDALEALCQSMPTIVGRDAA